VVSEYEVKIEDKLPRIGALGMIYMLASIIPQIVAIFLLPVFTRYLPPAQMAVVDLSNQVAIPLIIILRLGLNSSLTSQFFSIPAQDRPLLLRTLLWGQLFQGLIIGAALNIAGLFIAEKLLPGLSLTRQLLCLLWTMVVWYAFFNSFFQMANTLAQLTEKAWSSTALTLLEFGLRMCLAIVVIVVLGLKGFGYQTAIVCTMVVVGIISFGLVYHASEGGRFDPGLYKNSSLMGLHFMPHQIAIVLMLPVNIWMVGKLAAAEQLGIYAMGMRFAQLLTPPMVAMSNATYPTIAQLVQERTPESMKQHSRLNTVSIVFIAAMSLGILFFAPVLIKLLTAPAYHKAVLVVAPLVLGAFIYFSYGIIATPLVCMGKGTWLSITSISAVFVSLIASDILIPRFGITGAAWALAAGYTVQIIIALIIVESFYRLKLHAVRLFLVFLAFFILWRCDVYASEHFSMLAAILIKILLMAAILPVLLVTGIIRGQEIREYSVKFLNMIRNKIQVAGRSST
jgi:O-antigen/teichoic acid export membrane protein